MILTLSRKFGVGAFLVGTLSAVGAMSSFAEAKTAMKITHVVPAKAPRGQGAELAAKMINGDKRCDIDAKVYHAGQLGGTAALIEGLQIGSIEMVILPGSFLVGFQPLIGILDFPFFWPSERNNLAKIHKSDAMKKLLATTTEKGVVSLSIWHTGFKVWTSNKKLDTLEKYKGLKARVMPSGVLKQQARLLGMTPIDMPFSETYSALQNGAINAQENPITTNFFMKFYEVQKYVTMTNHGTLDQVIMVSKVWWDKRTAACQSVIRNAVDAGGKLTESLTYSIIDQKALPAFKKRGTKIIDVDTANYMKMKAMVLPGIEKFYVKQNGDRGQAIIDAFKADLKKLK
jgi:C4-dicarboxylate-binding protein DctP